MGKGPLGPTSEFEEPRASPAPDLLCRAHGFLLMPPGPGEDGETLTGEPLGLVTGEKERGLRVLFPPQAYD